MKGRSPIAWDAVGSRVLLTGNEAIARGAIEAGIQVATAYPGTPASEILEAMVPIASRFNIHLEWSTNEKVAFEVSMGASLAGLRAIACMKHVGVNLIMDPLMTVNLTGVKGGLVLVSADDPNGHNSQNEQDNRFYAMFAEIPALEPSDPQDAKDMTKTAFDISEEVGLPVMIRSVTRLSHSSGDLVLGKICKERRQATFAETERWISLPVVDLHRRLHEKLERTKRITEQLSFNKLEIGGNRKYGVIASGIAYNFAKEASTHLGVDGEINILKIGAINPLPEQTIRKMLNISKRILVIEEGEPYIEKHVKSLASELNNGLEVRGKLSGDLPREGELEHLPIIQVLARMVDRKISLFPSEREIWLKDAESLLVPRALTFCAGCPHMATYYALKRLIRKVRGQVIVTGDIGCYDMGMEPPFEALNTWHCMGSSIGIACGLAQSGLDKHIVAVIGDSTFFHSGIPPLINAVYNRANILVLILDNKTTAMTGHQPNPGTGITAINEKTREIKIEEIVKACGVDFVKIVDPYDVDSAVSAIEEAIRHRGVKVVISRRQCVLAMRQKAKRSGIPIKTHKVDPNKCTGCKVCVMQLGCQAMSLVAGKLNINENVCNGCDVCLQICPYKAIYVGETDDEGT